jgi:SnoaL-like domain
MMDLTGNFPTDRATMKTLAFAIGIWLTIDGTALAQQTACSDRSPPASWLPSRVTNPAPEDRQAIMDVIHSYAWALDDRNAEVLNELFTDDVAYEACSGGGQIQMVRTIDLESLILYLEGQFRDLVSKRFQTRHFETNVLLHSKDKDTVEGKTTLLVTIQRMDDAGIPEFDYTAIRRITFVRVEGIWRIVKLLLTTDTPEVEDRGR